MHAKSLLTAGALMLGLLLGLQAAHARTTAESGIVPSGDLRNDTGALSEPFQNDRYRARPVHQAYGYQLAYGGLPGPMIEDLRRGRRYDPPEYYDSRLGRWRHGYPHTVHRHHGSDR